MIKDCNLKDGKNHTNKRITSILKNHLQNYDIFVLIQIKSQKTAKKNGISQKRHTNQLFQ